MHVYANMCISVYMYMHMHNVCVYVYVLCICICTMYITPESECLRLLMDMFSGLMF